MKSGSQMRVALYPKSREKQDMLCLFPYHNKMGALHTQTSAQKAELIPLTRALAEAKDLTVIIYTDSKYAYHVLHAHADIWQERGFLTAQNSAIKHREDILQLSKAVQTSSKVSVIHCWNHQLGTGEIFQRNNLADCMSKSAAFCTKGYNIKTGNLYTLLAPLCFVPSSFLTGSVPFYL